MSEAPKRKVHPTPNPKNALDLSTCCLAPEVDKVYRQLKQVKCYDDVVAVCQEKKKYQFGHRHLRIPLEVGENGKPIWKRDWIIVFCKQWNSCQCEVCFIVDFLDRDEDGGFKVHVMADSHSPMEDDPANHVAVRMAKKQIIERRIRERYPFLPWDYETGSLKMVCNENLDEDSPEVTYSDSYRLKFQTKAGRKKKAKLAQTLAEEKRRNERRIYHTHWKRGYRRDQMMADVMRKVKGDLHERWKIQWANDMQEEKRKMQRDWKARWEQREKQLVKIDARLECQEELCRLKEEYEDERKMIFENNKLLSDQLAECEKTIRHMKTANNCGHDDYDQVVEERKMAVLENQRVTQENQRLKDLLRRIREDKCDQDDADDE